ncbi:TetR/AcrR family transcriptional regulator [Gordonia desulfuricans]|uniref:TetR/AcrR family transcriptional regulator n=1 Tax=Gordonia desulfuricans TaxID=89051 RepID=UPI00073E4338|nr:TetR/AcrR family transcriptional regulator [Gordonia desulfuricans]
MQDAVATAALDQLLEHGLPGLTIRGVAQAAGVAETTVYRRWPSTNHLAAAALLKLADDDNPLPDTGSLENDLRELLEQVVALLSRREVMRVVRGAAAMDDDDPTVAAAKDAFFSRRFANSTLIVKRAIARGELPAGTDAFRLIETLVAPAYLRAILVDRPLDDELVDTCVRFAIAGARAEPGTVNPPQP